MAGTGNSQIIGGVEYQIGTPAWSAARDAELKRVAALNGNLTGTQAGTALKTANDTAGLPPLGLSTSSSSGSLGLSTGTPSTIGSPSLAGLSAAAGGATQSAPKARIAPVDTSAAEAASFNKAKDTEGMTATGALTGLRSALGGRGMLGSGLEERGTASVANASAGRLGDVTRQQAVTRADEAQKNAETNFTGDITQRGQDYQHEESANSLAGDLATAGYQGQITQRGQDIQAQAAANAMKIEQAQLASQQRASALDGLTAALKVTAPSVTGAY